MPRRGRILYRAFAGVSIAPTHKVVLHVVLHRCAKALADGRPHEDSVGRFEPRSGRDLHAGVGVEQQRPEQRFRLRRRDFTEQ